MNHSAPTDCVACKSVPQAFTDNALIDSHCHLDFPGLSERLPEVLSDMQASNVVGALCVGVNLENRAQVLALAEAHPNLVASIGVHPEYDQVSEPQVDSLVQFASHPRVVAIGETGLDYHWRKERTEWQLQRFQIHIEAARKAGMPLIIHMREAADDTLAIMQDAKASEAGGVMHCFTENWSAAKRALDLGFYISFSGIVTFKNAISLHEVAQKTPLERILIETDSPYLAPTPHRGKTNQPAWVRFVAEKIAELRNIPPVQVAMATTENFFTCFPAARTRLVPSAQNSA